MRGHPEIPETHDIQQKMGHLKKSAAHLSSGPQFRSHVNAHIRSHIKPTFVVIQILTFVVISMPTFKIIKKANSKILDFGLEIHPNI